MDPGEPSPQKDSLSVENAGNVGPRSHTESASLSGSLPLRLHSSNKGAGSPQPSPLSQSTSADETAAEEMSTSIGRYTDLPPSATEVDAAPGHDDQPISEFPTTTLQHESKEQRPDSVAAVMQGRQPDPIPGTIPSTTNGNTSPDARLEKDYHREKATEERTAGEETDRDSSGDEDEGSRGRQPDRKKKHYRKDSNVSTASDTDGGSNAETLVGSARKPPRKLKTFEPLRKKEEERAKAASEPTVTITGPGGEKITVKKGPVHPNTNYDRAASRNVSPDSDELRDIRHAQSLTLWASPIDNITPQRVIRTILRGDYRGIQEEAKVKKRKLRTYFVATDISEEAAYALEWTIGTVLRDGDTLLAIYAVNKDTGTGETGDPERLDGLELSEGALAMQDTTATMEKMTSEAPQAPVSPPPSGGGGGALAAIGFGGPKTRRDSDRGSKDSRVRTKGEAERLHAIDVISETCINFLRKTRLQVRVTVEVISCKSPKHIITEAIDYFEPTLVILGSRGRGALKGTLLGSFSNYLVSKSSIPVMVARKKLKGRKAKNVNPTVRLANNLIPTTNSRLTKARID